MARRGYEMAFVDIPLVGKRETCKVVNASGFGGVCEVGRRLIHRRV
jgi:hypothetical protein